MTLDDNVDGQRGRMRTTTPDVNDDDGQQGRMRTRTRTTMREDDKGGQGHNNQKEVKDNEGL